MGVRTAGGVVVTKKVYGCNEKERVRTTGGVVVTKKVLECNEEGTCQNYRRCGCGEEGARV